MTGARRIRHPQLPDDPLEHSIQVKVIDTIDVGKTHPDIFAFAVPNAGRRGFQTAQKMKAEGMRSGVADICIMMPEAKTGWLEMKRLKGKQSTSQLGFQARCKRLGHPYAVAHTFDEAVTALRQMGVLR
ncbi:VRR-NUC domain-containing protein [Bradyrhizobium elkanii]|uniref:VRR-NUC domain-containing protein n=1 Tax=Bradyrhizobium elkanii TaxID=29448 RepID=UPI0004B54DBB|nr:VRR-NUC domain-containing protein [Bradyrhizobium elkanii]WLA79606.1 VRR-NUC domain-containing protein [Bradyrhizobium elkanii]